MLCVSAIYANRAGSHFDGDYYVRRHAPFARELLEPLGLTGLRITLGTAALDGTPAPYWALCELWFPDRETFDRALSIGGEALLKDTPNYTDVEPVLQLSTLVDA